MDQGIEGIMALVREQARTCTCKRGVRTGLDEDVNFQKVAEEKFYSNAAVDEKAEHNGKLFREGKVTKFLGEQKQLTAEGSGFAGHIGEKAALHLYESRR